MSQQTNVRLKLLIDTETESVLYGEANKDFIDFLFSLLSLPLGAVIRVLKKENMVGCLGNLYQSIQTLNDECFQPTQSKDTLLNPKLSFNSSSKLFPYIIDTSSTTSKSTTSIFPSTFPSTPSSYNNYCTPSMSTQSSTLFNTTSTLLFGPNVETVGFVKGLATYIVMDDLTVMHISEFSITTLFKKFNIKDVGTLEEKVITLNVDEGVELLKASLQSKMVLTDVFLRRERRIIDDDHNDVMFRNQLS